MRILAVIVFVMNILTLAEVKFKLTFKIHFISIFYIFYDLNNFFKLNFQIFQVFGKLFLNKNS